LSNPIDTRNLATTTIRRVNARTDREELSGEGRTAHNPRNKKGQSDQPLAFDAVLDPAHLASEETLHELNSAVSLLQGLLARIDAVVVLVQTGGARDALRTALQLPVFQNYALPDSTENPVHISVRVDAGISSEPYTITLHPVNAETVMDGNLAEIQQARAEYEAHHEWVSKALIERIPTETLEAFEDTNAEADQVRGELAACEHAPWLPGRLKNATRLLTR
jgi:hypothetical protein